MNGLTNGLFARPSLLVAIVLTSLAHTGPAQASTLERWLIMPGPVVQSHADIENACDNCHDPLSDRAQFELCVDCHTDVRDDLRDSAGLHGRLPESQGRECADCHTDHEGRDMTIVSLDPATFDHAATDFVLRGAHRPLACTDCHAAGARHRQASTTCIACHRTDDPHQGQLGQECDSCHSEQNWTDTGFNHVETAFPLTGKHDNLTCDACHSSTSFTIADRSCAACHQQHDVHKGRNGASCANCHVTDAWTALTFSHLAVSGFGLDGGHRGLGCTDCHSSSEFRDRGGANCNTCHHEDDIHETRNGSDCASCHVVNNWQAVNFDHRRDTGVALPPGHEQIACSGCHAGKLNEPLPNSCGGCHEGDDVHETQLGMQCESCHVATDWVAGIRFDHDLASFPLMGAHAGVACDRCHSSLAFHNADTYCLACHAGDDTHNGGFGNQCDDCHNPSHWLAWQFEHDRQTGFALEGAHAGVNCSACHESSIRGRTAISGSCNSCHDRDDPHLGRFGKNCNSCHTTSSFSRLEDD